MHEFSIRNLGWSFQKYKMFGLVSLVIVLIVRFENCYADTL